MAWATRDQARAHWPDSASLPDATLDTLLEVATTQCQMYAPALLTVTRTVALTTGDTLALAVGVTRFTAYDVGAKLTGEGVASGPPGPGTNISAVDPEGTEITLSRAATATVAESVLVVERVVPDIWMIACVYQAREVYAAGQREGDIIGLGDYAIRARPLTGTVRSLLRPETDPFVVA